MAAVKSALPKLKPGEPVRIVARVSESPEQRRKLQAQLTDMLPKNGAAKSSVVVLCAFKQGYSWLMDEIAPQLKGKHIGAIKIEFKKNDDSSHQRAMLSPARWVQELYPVDEMLSKELGVPLDKITLNDFDGDAKSPTYRVHAYDAAGGEILAREFTVTTAEQPYNGAIPRYEQVQIDTGWVRMESDAGVVLDQRIRTDIEEFWDHYQKTTLPRIYSFVMAQSRGELRPEFAPPFDTLKIDFHLSEPDYDLGLDKERISSLEALQEDTFYTTENFVNTMSDLEAGRAITYAGRIIPIVHRPGPDEGKDGRVHIEFYGKPAANPMAVLRWTDSTGRHRERKRDMFVPGDPMQPRLIAARVKAGPGMEDRGIESLTWLLNADYKEDRPRRMGPRGIGGPGGTRHFLRGASAWANSLVSGHAGRRRVHHRLGLASFAHRSHGIRVARAALGQSGQRRAARIRVVESHAFAVKRAPANRGFQAGFAAPGTGPMGQADLAEGKRCDLGQTRRESRRERVLDGT